MLTNLNIFGGGLIRRNHRSRVETIGRKARRSMLQRSLKLESLESRRVFATAILNEISNDPGGTDQPFEYIEIKGTPGATLPTGLYFASIEGDASAQGVADIVVDLGGQVLGSNGLLVIKSSTGGHTIPGATTIVTNASFNTSPTQTVENGTNTFALILSPNAPLVATTDYDTNTDGILELPPGASIVDAVGFTEGDNAADRTYGSVNLFSGANFMGGATRFLHDNRPNTTAAWFGGDLLSPNSGTAYTANVANRTANFPVGGQLTPGAPNLPGTNSAPVANADAYNMLALGTLNVAPGAGVLANDTDPDGIDSILSATLISGTTNGSLTLNDDGSFVYINNGTVGIDTFSYQATDLNLLSSTVTVTITVDTNPNIAPVISLPVGSLSYTENDLAIVIDVNATVSDIDTPAFNNGVLTVDFTANGLAEDRIEIRNEGSGIGQVGIVGSTVQFEGITIGTFVGGIGTTPLAVTFNSSATVSAVQAVVRNLTYRNASDAPSTLTRTLRAVVTDGAGGTSNESTVDISVAATNDDPSVILSKSAETYAAGGDAIGLDTAIMINDSDVVDFDGGILTISIAANSTSDESLTIRNVGNAAGQVGVAANVVSYGGVAIGSFSGGTSGSPLVVTFNASASQASIQEVARNVLFSTTNTRLTPAARTISFSLTDGDGGTSNLATLTLTQSQLRSYAFQEGVDNGQGQYTGAADIALHQNNPNTAFPVGQNLVDGLLVDYDAATANAQVLLRFDSIFGSGLGQVPEGSTIVSARLVVNTNNPGDGGRLHRMLTTWDANTSTWNSVSVPGGVLTDDIQARSSADASIGTSFGTGDAATGTTSIGVTADVQAWASGAANHGWLLKGWDLRTDGWAFSPSEASDLSFRPKLEIEWLPPSIANTGFRDGVNGYAGTVDTQLRETTAGNANTTSQATTVTLFSDYPDVEPSNTSQILLRFDDIVGSIAGQIPAGSYIHAAVLDAASTASNAPGDGGQFFTMLETWSETDTWDSRIAGVTADGVEASLVANTQAGNASLSPHAQGGFNSFDVTTDVQAWISSLQANHGWAILPWTDGINGWAIQSSESTIEQERPQLRVFYTPLGVSVTPTSGLTTTEAGGTASFSVVLDTPPLSNVTIPISSNDPSEGTTNVSQLVFTPTNWDIPQTVIISGVDDAALDGNKSYLIVTGPAVSADVNYNGFNASDVGVINEDDNLDVLAEPTLTITSSNVVYSNSVYVATASVTGFNAPDPTSSLTFEFYSDAGGTTIISAPENAGTYYVRAFTAANAGNVAAQSSIATFQITPFGLTATGIADNKIYDATTAATVTISLGGVFGGDTVTGSASATFDDKNVGVGKTVTIGGVTLAGADAGNYSVGSAGTATADITPFALTSSGTADSKVYDATTAATVTVSLGGVFGGDTVTGSASGTFDDKNVGVGKTVTIGTVTLGGADAGNYGVGSAGTATADITPFALTASGTAGSKVYDATTAATVTVSLGGVFGGDTVTGSASGAFDDKNVGVGKTVTIGTVALAGADAGNYSVGSAGTATADITAKAITGSITAANKVFDGNTSATILTRTLSGAELGDDVSYVGGTATFASAAVGTGIAVSATGLSLSGVDAGNYTVNDTAATTADITAAASVVNRRVFYNGGVGGATGFGASTNFSATAGNPPATAIDSKVALLPGQNSSFANYTNVSFGLNGIIVDIANPTGTLSAADFTFAKGETLSQAGFVPFTTTELTTTIVPVVTQYVGGGVGGSTRAKITFNNNSLRNTWVKITVLANANTGLAANDVFYFGNVVGDTQGSVTGGRYTVNAIDTSGARNNQSSVPNSVLVTNIFDFNKSGNVNALDTSVVRNNQQASGFVRVITNAAPMFLGDSVPEFGSEEDSEESNLLVNEVSSVVPSTVDHQSGMKAYSATSDAAVATLFLDDVASSEASSSSSGSIDDFFSKLGKEI